MVSNKGLGNTAAFFSRDNLYNPFFFSVCCFFFHEGCKDFIYLRPFPHQIELKLSEQAKGC